MVKLSPPAYSTQTSHQQQQQQPMITSQTQVPQHHQQQQQLLQQGQQQAPNQVPSTGQRQQQQQLLLQQGHPQQVLVVTLTPEQLAEQRWQQQVPQQQVFQPSQPRGPPPPPPAFGSTTFNPTMTPDFTTQNVIQQQAPIQQQQQWSQGYPRPPLPTVHQQPRQGANTVTVVQQPAPLTAANGFGGSGSSTFPQLTGSIGYNDASASPGGSGSTMPLQASQAGSILGAPPQYPQHPQFPQHQLPQVTLLNAGGVMSNNSQQPVPPAPPPLPPAPIAGEAQGSVKEVVGEALEQTDEQGDGRGVVEGVADVEDEGEGRPDTLSLFKHAQPPGAVLRHAAAMKSEFERTSQAPALKLAGAPAIPPAKIHQSDMSPAPAPDDKGPKQLIVNYIPPLVEPCELFALFEQFGPLECVKIMMNQQTGDSRGFGFIYFVNSADAAEAAKDMQGFEMYGKTLRVGYAVPQRPLNHNRVNKNQKRKA